MARTRRENSRQGNGLRDIYSVSQLNEKARAVLEHGLGFVWVEGEMSNLARPASGHIYFSLKDDTAQIRCAMFRNRVIGLRARPENGLHVQLYGRVSLYPARGDYQLIVETLEVAGDGLLSARFEALKRKLDAEGLFAAEHKRPLPAWPRAVGVVTSPSGAAVRDIINVLARRCPGIPVIVYPTAVQGETAAPSIVRAIERASARGECDVLIVGRGGGSLEDLWAFNEESVARAVRAASMPVVSAVGHEVDFTIADLAADLRAPTPSAAAELVSPDVGAARRRIAELARRLQAAQARALSARQRELRQLAARLVSPRRRLELAYQRVDELAQRLGQAIGVGLRLRRSRLDGARTRVAACSPATRLRAETRELEHLRGRLRAAAREVLRSRREALAQQAGLLRALGPGATLERGYAIVSNAAGEIVRDGAQLAPGELVETRLARGGFSAEVRTIASDAQSDGEGG